LTKKERASGNFDFKKANLPYLFKGWFVYRLRIHKKIRKRMKTNHLKIILALIMLSFAGSFCKTFAQQRPMKQRPRLSRNTYNGIDTIERKGVFISYPTNFIASTLKVGYEFKVSHNKGLSLLGSLGGSDNGNSFYGVNTFNEVGLESQLRFYILKDRPALNGLYMAPYVQFKSMAYTANYYDYNIGQEVSQKFNVSDVAIGYVIGYQYIFGSSFTFNAFLGGGDNFMSGDNSGGNLSTNLYGYSNGISIHTGIGIGIAF
jgi:hypothetical protein